MGREFEVKYRAQEHQLKAISRDFPGGQTIRMETTYYEIPSGTLARRHWTLRRRMENDVSVCTVKTPCPQGGRGEWEVECGNILEAVPLLIAEGAPAELAELVAEGPYPLCGARFVREAIPVTVGNAVVEIALDQGVLLGGSKELPLCEAEVELKQGTDEDAVRFAELLAKKYGLVPEKKSKFRRAKDLVGA